MAGLWTRKALDQQRQINRRVNSLIDDRNLPGLVHQLMPTLVVAKEEIKVGSVGECEFLGHSLRNPRRLGEFAQMWNRISDVPIPAGSECLAQRVAVPNDTDGGWVITRMICCDGDGLGRFVENNCECSDQGILCKVTLHIAGVHAHQNNDDGITWAASCNNVETGYTVHQCGNCESWNGRWPLFQQVGTDPDPCVYGIENVGLDSEEFPTDNRLIFPCSNTEEDATIDATVTCNPNERDETGSVSLAITRNGCQMFTLNFEKVDIFPGRSTVPLDRTNRVTQIGFSTSCFCINDAPTTPRTNNAQGNFNPTTATPDLKHGTGTNGHNYTATAEGFHDFGEGDEWVPNGAVVVYEPLYERWLIMQTGQYAPVEFQGDDGTDRYRFIDETGCDWTETANNALFWLTFEFCS